ncbi:hypothetical protein F4820DRAFT_453529 [Hypoxylon rubiginosum]|uniref:Uncharacterized protein n=1 Tax=Hypoxylon rubiginosum TaxID=110542 RepID=A0ACB9YL23_9PEZI|nr:hypothetical protein F4820DRAFT_453529 [Hypoxylon rubiginosum]
MSTESGPSYPPTRPLLICTCPQLRASSASVRIWVRSYLLYRGLEPDAANNFFWTGVELHEANISELQLAFKTCCEMHLWEADILAHDVYAILKESVPSKRTAFQAYVERFYGANHYRMLTTPTREWSPQDYVDNVFVWMGFALGLWILLARE